MYLVIDIGSNTIRAVVFHLEGEKLTPVLNKKYSAGGLFSVQGKMVPFF